MSNPKYKIKSLGEQDGFYDDRYEIIGEVVTLLQEPPKINPRGFWYKGVVYFEREVRRANVYFREANPYFFLEILLTPYEER